jgi:hypothetical protein
MIFFLTKIKKYWIFILLGMLSQVASILHAPNTFISGTKAAFCNYYITKFNFINIHIDCDSQYFLLDSQDPSRLLTNQSPLQDRPLHMLVVYIIYKLLSAIGVPSGAITYLGQDNIPQTYNVLNYAIFITLNAIFLIASIVLVMSVLINSKSRTGRYYKVSVFLLLILIAQNPVNREYFWTPHSQVFNILIPALLFFLVQKKFIVDRKRFILLMLFISTALLFYPTFLVVLPVFFLKTLRSLGKLYAAFTLAAMAPKLLWPEFVRTLGGNYVDWPVVGHRRFVWILDSLESGTLMHDLGNNVFAFLNSLPLAWMIISTIILFLGISHVKNVGIKDLWKRRPDLIDSAVATLVYTSGIVLNGEYGQRFTVGVVLLFSFIVLNEVSRVHKKSKYWDLGFFIAIVANFSIWLTN